MASSYNVVLLVDTVDSRLKERVKLLSLRLLNYLTCRAGLGQVRWSYRFLNSAEGRGRPSRRTDLRELGPRSWDEFEEELEACWKRGRGSAARNSRAAVTHTALLETLSDFQWDQPDITSPAKPAVLRGRRGRLVVVDKPLKPESPAGGRNALFLLSPCPHSHQELRHYTGYPEEHDTGLQHVMERLLPRGLHGILTSKRVTLYWLDTFPWTQVWNSSDHFGYWTMVELMQLVGGKILPSEPLLESALQEESKKPPPCGEPLKIPCDSVLNSLIRNECELKAQFPRQDGTLYFCANGGIDKLNCAVTLEPVCANQSLFKSFIRIHLKGTVQSQNCHQMGPLMCDTWVLQSVPDCQAPSLQLQQLLHAAMSKGMLLIAEVSLENDFSQKTGVLSPVSGTSAILNVIRSGPSAGLDCSCVGRIEKESNEEISSDLPDIVKSVLRHAFSSEDKTLSPDVRMPEWIKQELSQSSHWSTSVIERWYTLSGASGATSNLMESFSLINAACFDEDKQSFDQDITLYLSELYQKKLSDESGNIIQGENEKKRMPRTPVRQKMKTMPRSLQMLNAARLYSKSQKSLPDGPSAAPAEKGSQVKRRSSENPEPLNKKQKGFESEDELVSFLKMEYDEAVSGEESLLLSCVRNAFTAINSYLKSVRSKQIEADCMEKIRILLKTSKMIRQHYGQNPNKEAKLRECQLQAMFRLEMCMQCPSVQTEIELEQTVEEITDMLRIISLTEDPSFLAKFLASVLAEYIGSIPKILSDIYFSLGIRIPEELALALPCEGDDSLKYDGTTPMYSQPSISRVPSIPVVNEEDQLEELRTRSAKKRRTSTLARHRSIAESSQTLRQIEVPKKHSNKDNVNLNPVIMLEKLRLPLMTLQQKEAEAAKVRRNLFVQEKLSSTSRISKMTRSQSVSVVEGLKPEHGKSHDGARDHHRLLTKKVTETPVHKQISNRLLQKQIKGRRSESMSDVDIVEESPEKDLRELDVRRSPRIKLLALTRRNSSAFYASQPKSRNLGRINSASQQIFVEDKKGIVSSAKSKSPKSLLFGEVLGMNSPPKRKARRKLLSEPEILSHKMSDKSQTKTRRKNLQKAVLSSEESAEKYISRKSPCTPKNNKTPSGSPVERKSATKNLGKHFSPSRIGEKTNLTSPEKPGKSNSLNTWLASPLKTLEHRTPRKQGAQETHHEEIFKSPQRTPKNFANTRTSAKQKLQALCTPRKSPRLQSLNAESLTLTHYRLQTPQKSVLTVPQTPTPKKCAEWSGPFPLASECTPKKSYCSPQTFAATLDSMSPKSISSLTTKYQLHTPQKSSSSVSESPMPTKCLKWQASVFPLVTECTPKKLNCSPSKQNVAGELSMSPQITSSSARYALRTPQKSVLSVPKTPTPNKCVQWKTSVFPLATECTPKKLSCSPLNKHVAGELSISPKTTSLGARNMLQTPKKPMLVPKIPTPEKCLEKNTAFPFVSECTPKKSDGSPRKHAVVELCTSPKSSSLATEYQLQTPQKSCLSVPKTPTSKKCVMWKNSVLYPIVNECTPEKSEISPKICTDAEIFISPKSALSLETGSLPIRLCSPLLETPKNLQPINSKTENILLPDSAYILHPESINDGTINPFASPSLHSSPVLRKIADKVSPPELKVSSICEMISPKGKLVVLCEKLDLSSLGSSGSGSLVNSSQTDESIDIAEAKVVPTNTSDLKMKFVITRKPSGSGSLSSRPSTPQNLDSLQCMSSYGLRHTIDRRQREAEARLGTPKIPAKFSTPKSQKEDPPPIYEVQLEMKESGLPKLRFKRTDSNSTIDQGNRTRIEESPTVSRTKKGDESAFGEVWCNRHAMKLESGGLSPCLRSAHNTPGKSSLQTFICQSYTPKRCASNTASPAQADGACPWTPSPKYKEKNGSDINNWPRRKKATAVTANVPKGDTNQVYALGTCSTDEESQELVNKASPLNEFLLDGVSKLLESSPVIEYKGKRNIGARTLKSRKRCFDFFSPSKEALPSGKRSCTLSGTVEDLEEAVSSSQSLSSNLSSSQQSSCEDEVFSAAVITPPARGSKNAISASGLLSLTQSPMLFKGRTPSSKRKAQAWESQLGTPEQKRPVLQNINPDGSPFSSAGPKPTISRNYSRKKLIT